jgi:outer membrane protein
MKQIIYSLVVVTLLLTAGTSVAQSQKIGHINLQTLVSAMPESDSAQVLLQKTQKEMEATYQQMQAEFNKKYEEFNKNSKSYNELVKTTRESEIQDMGKRLQTFQSNAQQNLQQLNQRLLKPILDKANKAIADVAKEGKFTYILDTNASNGVVLYTGPDAIDILALAKKKIGIK